MAPILPIIRKISQTIHAAKSSQSDAQLRIKSVQSRTFAKESHRSSEKLAILKQFKALQNRFNSAILRRIKPPN